MPVSHAQAEVSSLLEVLAGITDPRRRRGRRHRLVAVLGVVVVAVLAGATNYRELGSVAADLPQGLLGLLGVRWDAVRGRRAAPSAGTLRRVLIALDGDKLDCVVGAWLGAHAACDAEGWAVALDGKIVNGAGDSEGRMALFSAMAHRAPGRDAVVLAQSAVPRGTTETTQVPALVEQVDLTGALITADAAHTSADTARYLVEDKGADYLLTVKANTPGLHTAAMTIARGLITAEPDHVCQERGHGRISRWSAWNAGVGQAIALPHAARLAVIRRDTADLAGQPYSKDIALVITSRARLSAAQICDHTRRHWGIENLEHRPRDTVWREDDQQAYLGNGPRTMATLRNLALGLLTINGITAIKQTVQAIGRHPTRAIPLIT